MADKVGFIGLGIMGKPMAENLIKGKCGLMVYDIDPRKCSGLLTSGVEASDSPSGISARCGVIFMIVPNGKIVKDICFGENGLCKTLAAGSTVVDMSSVTPGDSREVALRLAEMSVDFIDAPVSGGEPKAIDGTLAIMAGGKKEAFEKVLPYFKMMGSTATLVGGIGSGSTAKLVNQMIVNLTIAAVSEAFVLASKAGVDVQKVYEAIRAGLAGSTVLDAKFPMMAGRNFKPGGRLDINMKDIKNVMDTAFSLDVPVPFTSQLLEIMKALKADGKLGDDHSGIVQYFEKLAGVEVKKQG